MRRFNLPFLLFFSLFLGAASAEPRWYKGNTHTHSLWSDGDGFPDMIADWYKQQGYNFLVLSDHNVLSRGERWIPVERLRSKKALPGYQERFGDRVDLRTVKGKQEVRLKRFDELKKEFDESGTFLLVEGEEITDKAPHPEKFLAKVPVHINAMNLAELVKPRGGTNVVEVMRNNLQALREQEKKTGKAILDHLNHPNFGYGVSVDDLAAVAEEQFFEVYNGHPGVNHAGSGERPGVEEMWDRINALRIFELETPPLYGLATDDSHQYHGGKVSPGRGWVMVKAASLEPDALVEAMRRGDFYASSGVELQGLEYIRKDRLLRFNIKPDGDAEFTTRIIGLNRTGMTGRSLHKTSKHEISFRVPHGMCVRAEITSSKAHPNPSLKGQLKQAWTQPVGWR